MSKRLIVIAPLAIVGFTAFIALGGLVVQWLWNWLLPPLFGWAQVTFWQALGLLALCRILFGGFSRHKEHGPRPQMSAEERQRFRQRIRERFGFGQSADQSAGR